MHGSIDEIRGSGPDNATFTLSAPGGGVLASVTYTPDGGTNGQWTELLTVDPDAHGTGTNLLRVTASNNDDNSWRLSFDHDPDCAVTGSPGTCAPASLASGNEVDNPDGLPGTGDEITIGIQRASYQHGGSGQSCKTFYFFVAPGTPSITLHNFDMDNNGADDVIGDFGVDGIFVKRNLGAWVKLHNNDPEAMTIGNLDGTAGDDLWSTSPAVLACRPA